MKLYNLKNHSEQVSFVQVVTQELGKDRGLFSPHDLLEFNPTEVGEMLNQDFASRNAKTLSAFIGDEIPQKILEEYVHVASIFPVPVAQVAVDVGCLESLHGPTLALEDFGGHFVTQMLTHISGDRPVAILAVTSGDTEVAVAHTSYGLEDVHVVTLYPNGRIDPSREKLFCTLGGNIETVTIDGDFNTCQVLAKQAFDDEELRVALELNSAGSINTSRLLAQIRYYFEAVTQLPQEARNQLVTSIPSGDFDDLTVGPLAKPLSLLVKRLIAVANVNDTVPHLLAEDEWAPKAARATLSNAMGVSQPNNWSRMRELFHCKIRRLNESSYIAVDDTATQDMMHEPHEIGYISEPHTAVAYRILCDQLSPGKYGLFLGTVRPMKFKENVEEILDLTLALPEELTECVDLPLLSHHLPAGFAELRRLMMARGQQLRPLTLYTTDRQNLQVG